ncbi:hypothetical protein OEZ86_006639 [Tetradesmus obliquus]|nr:hypothetical protein OEZ86_006639 [Tetradesmus obliquus]
MQLSTLQRSESCCSRRRAVSHRARLQVCKVFWSRQPDDWDAQWEVEEQARRMQSQQAGVQRAAAEEAAWQQQVEDAHQQLLNQQKQRAALRSRIEQDARRAKAEQLRRIEPVAKARARAQGLASLGLDPEIMSLSAADACTEIIYKDKCSNNAVISGRTLSFPVSLTPETKAINGYSKDSSKIDAINFMNLGGWALAWYSTVEQLKEALANTQVVWDPEYDAFGKAISNGLAKVPTLHLVFHDSSGASLVVQWRNGKMEVLDNPLGVFANDPLLQDNYKHFEGYRKDMFSNPAGVHPSVKQAASHGDSKGLLGASKGPKPYFWSVPGGYSGPSRFTRLARMKGAADSECWSAKSLLFPQLFETLSPAYVFKGAPAANQAMLAVMGILNTVYLPRGVSDTGTRGPSGMPEFTLYTTIRDHDNKVFYYRTANNPVYKAIDFNKIDWAGMKGAVQHSYMVFAEDPWFRDYSNEFKQGIWGTGSKELVTKGGA